MTTEPFNFEGTLDKCSDKVLNVRRPNKPQFPCYDRAKLLESLAQALVSWQDHDHDIHDSEVDRWFRELQDSTERVRLTIDSYFELMKQRIIVRKTGRKGKGRRRSSVEQAWTIIEEVIGSITREDYAKIERHAWMDENLRRIPPRSLSDHDVKLALVEEMERCFKAFGPSKFNQGDRDQAIAAILRHFGVEDGKLLTIADTNRHSINLKRRQQDSE